MSGLSFPLYMKYRVFHSLTCNKEVYTEIGIWSCSLGEAQHATAAASKRSVSEPRQRPVRLTPVPEMCPAREANSHSRTPPGQALDQLGLSPASLAGQEPKRRSLPADLSRSPPVSTR